MKRIFNIGQVAQVAGAAWAFLKSLPVRTGNWRCSLATQATEFTARVKSLRMLSWFTINVVMVGAVYLLQPTLIPVLVFKACQVTMSGWIGYWFDRGIAPATRPGNPDLTPAERAAASIRRALIVAAAMIAGALGA